MVCIVLKIIKLHSHWSLVVQRVVMYASFVKYVKLWALNLYSGFIGPNDVFVWGPTFDN